MEAGLVINERYRVVSLLGRGGMCSVYEAHDLQLDRVVALKVLNNETLAQSRTIERFQREGAIIAALRHPNIVEVFGCGVFNGRPFMAMELLKGSSLGEMIPDRGMALEQALPIFLQICDALTYAHQQGVIHRDLKPSNVMIVPDTAGGAMPIAKLTDFGIARFLPESGKEWQKLTQTGAIIGTIAYMSPEQCGGTNVDARCDIYSMGALSYHVLSGQLPFPGDSAFNIIAQQLLAPPPAIPGISADLMNILRAAMSSEPDQRPQTAEELKKMLEAPQTYRTAAPAAPAKKRSLLTPLALSSMAALSLLAFGAISLWHQLTTPPLPDQYEESMRKASRCRKREDWEGAIANYREAYLWAGRDASKNGAPKWTAAENLAIVCAERDHDEEGKRVALEIIAAYEDRGVVKENNEFYRTARYALGLAQYHLKEPKESENSFSSLVQRAEEIKDAELAARARYYLASICYDRGDYDQAISHFDKVLQIFKGSWKYRVGSCLLKAESLLKRKQVTDADRVEAEKLLAEVVAARVDNEVDQRWHDQAEKLLAEIKQDARRTN